MSVHVPASIPTISGAIAKACPFIRPDQIQPARSGSCHIAAFCLHFIILRLIRYPLAVRFLPGSLSIVDSTVPARHNETVSLIG
ncbi:MAG: hypothetical protein SCM11_13545 [Bacillota bacterium]|nr:hypothetical protein [Bacillota bacterium]